MANAEVDKLQAELRARGIDPDNPPANIPQDGGGSLDEIQAELQRRGIPLPKPEPPSTVPSYASPAQQQAYPISSMLSKGLGVGLEALNAPFQAIGEPIRRAVTQTEGTDPGPYRIPTILQRFLPKTQTAEQAPDMFSAAINPAYAALKAGTQGAASLVQGKGVDQAKTDANSAFNQPPGLPEAALSTAAAIGSGEAGNIPFKAAAAPLLAIGKLIDTGEMAGIPGFGMLAKAKTGTDFMPLGLENLTAKADPELLDLQHSADPKVATAAKSMTPAAMTGSPTQSAIEGFLAKLPFSSNIMREKFASGLKALTDVREPIVEASKPAADLGLDVQNAISNSSNLAYKNAQSLYENASSALPQGAQIPLNKVQETASNILEAQSKLPSGAQASKAAPLLRDLAGQGFEAPVVGRAMPNALDAAQGANSTGVRGHAVPAYDYPTIQNLRAELNSRIAEANTAIGSASPKASFQSSPEAGVYSTLKKALDKDLGDFSTKTGGSFKSALDKANSAYSTFKQSYSEDKFIQSILKEQNPENVINKIVKSATDNPRALGMLKLNLPTETLNDLQTYFIKDMTEKTPDVFSPNHFVNQYNRIGEKRLTDILGPDKVQQLRPLYVMSKAGQTAERLGQTATGPSGAGATAAGVGLTPAIMMAMRMAAKGEPIKGAALGAGIIGAEMESLPMLAKAYLSGPAGKFLTRQPTGIGPSADTVSNVAKTAGKISPNVQEMIRQLQQKFADRNKF